MLKVEKRYEECTVFFKGKKFILGKATEAQLKDLHRRGHVGIYEQKEEVKKEEAKK